MFLVLNADDAAEISRENLEELRKSGQGSHEGTFLSTIKRLSERRRVES